MNVATKLCVEIILLLQVSLVEAQEAIQPKAKFYVALGTHWSFYSKGDIRLKSTGTPAYDFTLQSVSGKDDGGPKFDNGAPQYSYQAGYYNARKSWGIEFNFDHIKYYVRQNQKTLLRGTINDIRYNMDTLITPNFIQLEHSDGGNYTLLKFVKEKALFESSNNNEVWHFLLKVGAGPVIPKTNSTIMGKHRDDRYQISGYVIALETGLRYLLSKLLFVETNAKAAYANYNQFLIADGIGSQQWVGVHFGLLLGLQLKNK